MKIGMAAADIAALEDVKLLAESVFKAMNNLESCKVSKKKLVIITY